MEQRPPVDVLVPTCDRPGSLAVVLTALLGQADDRPRVVVSDQSERPVEDDPLVAAVLRVLRHAGHEVEVHRHLPRRGVTEQRDFLLSRARAPQVLYLDDDVLLAPGTLRRLRRALAERGGAFAAAPVTGLSHAGDDRPHERAAFAELPGAAEPERVRKGTPGWERWRLHNAANPTHLERDAGLGWDEDPETGRYAAYRVAWSSGCVLLDRARLEEVGGFGFWRDLAAADQGAEAGEDVVVQLRLQERFGGFGVIPSGAVHLELPTTVVDRRADAYALVLEAADRGHPRVPA